MPAPIQTVLEEVAKRIVPGNPERNRMARLADRLRDQVQGILEDSGFEGIVSVQGSFARDTWLSGEADLDIFAAFPPSMERREWTEKILPSIKKGIKAKAIDRYAEHPFLEFHLEGIRVNIVPCYSVDKGQWKSATDRTPFHTEYMQKHLTAEMRLEARLLKRFLKGIRSYGAEIRVGGFSGMLVETLIVHYTSFQKTLEQVSKWTPMIFLDLEKPGLDQDSRARKFNAPLVVVDPVDPDRNLAAAVRQDKLWNLVAASRELQANPGLWYFFPPKPKNKAQFTKLVENLDRDIVAVTFQHAPIVPDVLWGQLLKIEKGLTELMIRQDFHPLRSVAWSDEKGSSSILVELESFTLPPTHICQGPPVSKREDSQGFLNRHLTSKETVRGPWVDNDRWVVDKKREILDIGRLVAVALKDRNLGLSVPDQLRTRSGRNVRVLVNRSILSLTGREDFDQVLSDFLAAKPAWLRPHH
jgi:tRNA nucleotidyltransferase (CCA-adding enzyme)